MQSIILLPTYNERENARSIIPEIFALLPETEILVIDDDSPDKTAEVVRDLMRTYQKLGLLTREKKQGLGEAYKHGLKTILARQDIDAVITMDADGSHDPRYLPALLQALESYDLAVGSRYVKGGGIENWEKWRYLLSKYGNLYSFLLSGVPVHDLTAGFVAFRRSILEKLDFSTLAATGYAYQIEFKFHLIHDLNAHVTEVPIVFKSRRGGESKISRHIIREGLKTPLRLFMRRFF